MKAPPDPPFLPRSTYRRRRLLDASRVLPFFGAFLFLLPVLWGANRSVSTAAAGAYVFIVWIGLIVAAGLLSRWLSRMPQDDRHEDG